MGQIFCDDGGGDSGSGSYSNLILSIGIGTCDQDPLCFIHAVIQINDYYISYDAYNGGLLLSSVLEGE